MLIKKLFRSFNETHSDLSTMSTSVTKFTWIVLTHFTGIIKVSGATARWPFTDSAVPSSLLLLLFLLFLLLLFF